MSGRSKLRTTEQMRLYQRRARARRYRQLYADSPHRCRVCDTPFPTQCGLRVHRTLLDH